MENRSCIFCDTEKETNWCPKCKLFVSVYVDGFYISYPTPDDWKNKAIQIVDRGKDESNT